MEATVRLAVLSREQPDDGSLATKLPVASEVLTRKEAILLPLKLSNKTDLFGKLCDKYISSWAKVLKAAWVAL